MFTTPEKLLFLNLIKEKKHLLFGAFDGEKITAETKKQEWLAILEELRARGTDLKKREWVHFRDVVWTNLKRAALVRKLQILIVHIFLPSTILMFMKKYYII